MVEKPQDGLSPMEVVERLHFATRPGWLDVLRIQSDFSAGEIERVIGVGRGPALKQLDRAAELGLVVRSSTDRVGRGGAFRWRVTNEGVGMAVRASAFIETLSSEAQDRSAPTVAMIAIGGTGFEPLKEQPAPDDLIDALGRLLGRRASLRSDVYQVTRA